MSHAGPTLLALETDSAWVVILGVSLVTLPLVLLLRRLIGRPGGLASGLLLIAPLALPLLAALVYQHAVLPEVAVLRPAGDAISRHPSDLLHFMLVGDGDGRSFVPYALTGSAGPYLFLFGAAVSSFMLLRRLAGTLLIQRLVRRCERPDEVMHSEALGMVERLSARAGLKRMPQLLLLPPGMIGAFATGGGGGRILVSEALIEDLEADEIEAVLAHEISHLLAKDVQMVALAGTLRDVVAWNPLAHLAYRRFASHREYEADRRAAALVGSPLAVASGLVKMCDLIRVSGARRRAALAFLGQGSRVKRRVRALLALADGRTSSLSVGSTPYVVATFLVAILGFQAAARIAQDGGALAIMWGGPSDAEARTWSSSNPTYVPARRAALQGETLEKAHLKDRVLDGVGATVSFQRTELSPFLRELSRIVRRSEPSAPLVFSEVPTNWEAVPLVSDADRFGIYRINQLR